MRFSFPKFIQACLRTKPLEPWDGLELTEVRRQMIQLEFEPWKGEVLATQGQSNLATLLAFQYRQGWSSSKPANLRVLAELGADINQPDVQGRVAGLEGIANSTRPLTMADLEHATDLGFDVLSVEAGSRSILSIDMSVNYLYRDMVLGIQSLVQTKIESLDASARQVAIEDISNTPLQPEHVRFWARLRSSYLEQSLPAVTPNTSAPSPSLRF